MKGRKRWLTNPVWLAVNTEGKTCLTCTSLTKGELGALSKREGARSVSELVLGGQMNGNVTEHRQKNVSSHSRPHCPV